jgi:hypothetical protein
MAARDNETAQKRGASDVPDESDALHVAADGDMEHTRVAAGNSG